MPVAYFAWLAVPEHHQTKSKHTPPAEELISQQPGHCQEREAGMQPLDAGVHYLIHYTALQRRVSRLANQKQS
jgi:hypothetical protein